MKTQTMKLIFLATMLSMVSCNEQVSSELQDAANSGSTTTTTAVPTIQTFGLSITTSPILGYKLHRTGFAYDAGTGSYTSRRTTECKVSSPDGVPLSNALYDAEAFDLHDDKMYDISCFLEAEELALYLGGIDGIQVEASGNACNSVGFSPFSYFSYMPGSSTTSYRTLKCPEDATSTTPAGQNGQTCGTYRNVTGVGAGAPVEQFPTNNITTPEDESELCRFDYTDQDGPNCDIGTVTIYEYNYRLTDPADPASALIPDAKPLTTRQVKCGGKIAACVNGGIKNITGITGADKFTSLVMYENTVADTAYSKKWTFPALIQEQAGSNMQYVNYRRGLATKEVEYGDEIVDPVAYKDAFNGATYLTPRQNYEMTFDPNLMANYAANKKMDLTTKYVSNATVSAYSDALFYKSTPYAAEPFMSLSSTYPINPFYTFTCFDKAKEPKARIRLVIREWDRAFNDPAVSDEFDYASDLFLDQTANQDNNFQDNYGEELNDFQDWDDLIPMSRSGFLFNSTTTTYLPANGVFSPLIFNYDLSTAEPE